MEEGFDFLGILVPHLNFFPAIDPGLVQSHADKHGVAPRFIPAPNLSCIFGIDFIFDQRDKRFGFFFQ